MYEPINEVQIIMVFDKGEERYVWTFYDTEEQRRRLIRSMLKFAKDEELNFNYQNAATMAAKLEERE